MPDDDTHWCLSHYSGISWKGEDCGCERLGGWEVWNDVTRSLGRNIAVITTITRGRGRGDNHNLMFRVWSNKAGGGDVNWGWAGDGVGVSPGLYLKQNLPSLFVWGHSLSLSLGSFHDSEDTWPPVPLVWSHQCCGHSLHNCHPLITTSGDTFHRLGHLNRESVRYPVILFYDNCRTRIYYRKSKMHVLKKTGTRFLCFHSSHDC